MKGKKPEVQQQQKQLITDPRFSFINFDPRFQKQKKQQTKISIDKRFKSVLEGEKFQRGAKFDKFGRKSKVNKKNNELGEIYYLEDEEEKENKQEEENEIEESSEDDEEESGKFQWNEVSSSEEEEQEDSNEAQEEALDNENIWETMEEQNVERKNIEATKRLAMQNYEWTQINSKDIMMLMNSFKRQEGVITKVTVYPSDYGLKQLALEEQFGPQGIWKDQKEPKKNEKKKNKIDDINEWIVKEGSKGDSEGIDGQKLREYEKQRMKYYYAVIEFDSEVTAQLVYDQLDGVEFEDTQMKIDLRFVPKDLSFPNEPKEVCTELPQNYKMNNFLNRALTHTFVKMTWDEPQMNRLQLPKPGNQQNDEFDENIVKQYLASDIEKISGESSDEEVFKKGSESDSGEDMVIEFDDDKDNNEKCKEKQGNKNWRHDFNKKNRGNNDVEMEITFNQGFEELGNKILDKQKQKNESAHDTFLRHKKERKQQIKLKKKMKNPEDFFVDETHNKNQNKLSEKQLKDKQLAELELLIDKDKAEEFEPNVNDDRFQAIYTTNKYSMDPTKNKNIQDSKFFKEQVQRRKQIKKN